MSIGVAIITRNRPEYFHECLKSVLSISQDSLQQIVVVNDGDDIPGFEGHDRVHYIKNDDNLGVGVSKNKGLQRLLDEQCDHLFVLEDDVIIHDRTTFNIYIHTSKLTGIEHLNFCLHGGDNKRNGKSAPKLVVDYKDVKLSLYHNVYGALSYYTRGCLDRVGLMDEVYFNAMEHVDHTMQIIESGMHPPFRWFADVHDSDRLIHEQDHNHSGSTIRKDQEWMDRFMKGVERFHDKFNINVCNPSDPVASKEQVIEYLRKVKPK